MGNKKPLVYSKSRSIKLRGDHDALLIALSKKKGMNASELAREILGRELEKMARELKLSK